MNKNWANYFDQSFLGHAYLGHLHWDLIKEFPQENPKESEVGSKHVSEVLSFIEENFDEKKFQNDPVLSQEFLLALKKTIYPRLLCSKELGGGELSNLNSFKVLQAAFARALPAGFAMAVSNSFGVAGLIQALPDCDFKKYISKKIQEGVLSGWADTEPFGASNWLPLTTAVSHDGGKTFVVNGEKCYIGNGSVADVLIVSVTLDINRTGPECALIAVDTKSPGFSVRKVHEFMGISGAPVAALKFENVVIHREQLLETPENHWRDTLMIEPVSALGRMLTPVAASSALSKKSLNCMLEFQDKRIIDGKPLREYSKIKALMAKSISEIFAIDSVILWCLHGSDGDQLPNRWWEQVAAKNIVTMQSSRIADRAISVLGAGGYENEESRKSLGYLAYPVEQIYRDARAFRISGGVDFLIDFFSAQRWLMAFFYNDNFDYKQKRDYFAKNKTIAISDDYLSSDNQKHLNYLSEATGNFGDLISELAQTLSAKEFLAEQALITLLNRYANEIFTIAVTLARARSLVKTGDECGNLLAEEYASEGINKLESYWSKIQREVDLIISANDRRDKLAGYLDAHKNSFVM